MNYACKKQKICVLSIHTHKNQQNKKPQTSGLSLLYHLLWNKKIKFWLLSQPRLPIQLVKSKNKLMFIWSSKELFKLPSLMFPLRHSTSFKHLYAEISIVVYTKDAASSSWFFDLNQNEAKSLHFKILFLFLFFFISLKRVNFLWLVTIKTYFISL